MSGIAANISFNTTDIFSVDTNHVLIGTRKQGLFTYDTINNFQFIKNPAFKKINRLLLQNQLYSGTVLTDNYFALGMYNQGTIIINNKGEITQAINKENGLQNDNTRYLYNSYNNNL